VIPIPLLARGLPRWMVSLSKTLAKAFWGWYWRLAMVPMLIATAAVLLAGWIAIAALPLPSAQQEELHRLLGSLFVVVFLLVLIVGTCRGGRGR
jgi:hypothetical protein